MFEYLPKELTLYILDFFSLTERAQLGILSKPFYGEVNDPVFIGTIKNKLQQMWPAYFTEERLAIIAAKKVPLLSFFIALKRTSLLTQDAIKIATAVTFPSLIEVMAASSNKLAPMWKEILNGKININLESLYYNLTNSFGDDKKEKIIVQYFSQELKNSIEACQGHVCILLAIVKAVADKKSFLGTFSEEEIITLIANNPAVTHTNNFLYLANHLAINKMLRLIAADVVIINQHDKSQLKWLHSLFHLAPASQLQDFQQAINNKINELISSSPDSLISVLKEEAGKIGTGMQSYVREKILPMIKDYQCYLYNDVRKLTINTI